MENDGRVEEPENVNEVPPPVETPDENPPPPKGKACAPTSCEDWGY